MLFSGIIVDILVVDDNGVEGVARVADALQGVEISHPTIHRLEVRFVGLLHPNGVDERIDLQIQLVDVVPIAHRQREAVGVDLMVDEHRVVAIGTRGGNGERIGQRADGPHELVVGVDGVVQRTVDRRASRQGQAHEQQEHAAPCLQPTATTRLHWPVMVSHIRRTLGRTLRWFSLSDSRCGWGSDG